MFIHLFSKKDASMSIDKNSFVPLYHQLFEKIKMQISKGELNPGDTVPSESKLVTKYNVSRGTVRQAMQKLEHENLIEKFPGRGTFIAEPQTLKPLAPKETVPPKNNRNTQYFRPNHLQYLKNSIYKNY